MACSVEFLPRDLTIGGARNGYGPGLPRKRGLSKMTSPRVPKLFAATVEMTTVLTNTSPRALKHAVGQEVTLAYSSAHPLEGGRPAVVGLAIIGGGGGDRPRGLTCVGLRQAGDGCTWNAWGVQCNLTLMSRVPSKFAPPPPHF